MQTHAIKPGKPHPLGSTPRENGVNFSLFSRNATSVELLLFKEHHDLDPYQIIKFDIKTNKSFFFWHVFVEGLKPGTHYAYRVDGPCDLASGHRFNKNKVLIDPYSKGNYTAHWNSAAACNDQDNLHQSMRSVVIDIKDYDWEDDKPLNHSMNELIIYEVHVGGFTKSPTSKVKHPGTFKGLTEKVGYLKDLGITAVELLPVFEFDDKDILKITEDGRILTNYWGYSTVGFFAPDDNYCVNHHEGKHVNEFRDMVKALHKAGIEVILDVVFNHTNEGNDQGPVFCFKGLDNSIYYHLVEKDKKYYMDFTGCGNTVNCNHPIVEKFIVECLEYWVKEMHVDGFRFDEGSVLSRGEDGVPLVHPPVIWNIELSETMIETKVIAEAWDAAGLYQIGYFPGYRWAEWNGKYRDDIRSFIKGDPGMIAKAASRISGSSDIYQTSGHLPINSINFIDCHDGFTLNDLVSYNEKHNMANGENNNDGISDNLSWNCGIEGATDDIEVEKLRNIQIKNFIAILMLSQGVPMFVAGDEIRRTQNGNNNTYCQDNELNWFNWDLVEKHKDIYLFFKKMIAFRKCHPIIHRTRFFTGEINSRGLKDIHWHGCKLDNPEWNNPECKVLSFTMGGFDQDPDLHVMFNMHWECASFELPEILKRDWYRIVDTGLPSPEDFINHGHEIKIKDKNYLVGSRSIVILISK